MIRPFFYGGLLILLGETVLLTENIFIKMLLLAAAVLIMILKGNNLRRRKCNKLLLFLCFAAGIILGLFTLEQDKRIEERKKQLEKGMVHGEILLIEEGEDRTRFVLKEDGLKYLIYSEVSDGLKEGMTVRAYGSPGEFKECTNPGGFDLENYYKSKGIGILFYAEKVETERKTAGDIISYVKTGMSYIRTGLFDVRTALSQSIERLYDKEDAALLKAMLLGERAGLSKSTKLRYQRSGLMHMLAISGMHIAIIAGFFGKLLGMLGMGRKKRCFIVMTFVIMYGLMTGFAASTIRAVVMLLIVEFGFLIKKSSDIPTSAMAGALIIAISEPRQVFTSGMQLSFAAIAGVYFSRYMYRAFFMRDRFLFLKKIRQRKLLKLCIRTVLMMVTVNLFMLGLIVYYYYEIPVSGLLLNLMIMPTVSVAMGAALFSAVAGLILPMAGMGAAFLVKILLRFYDILTGISPLVISSGHAEILQVIIYYCIITGAALLIAFLVDKKRVTRIPDMKERFKKGITWLGIYIAVMLVAATSFVGIVKLEIMSQSRLLVMDVGQGQGVIITESFGPSYVVDFGSTSEKSVGEYVLIPALKYYGINEVEGIFISHTDEDHISGINELIKSAADYGIRIKNIYMAGGTIFEAGTEEKGTEIKKGKTEKSSYETEKSDETGQDKKTKVVTRGMNETSYGGCRLTGLNTGDRIGKFEVLYPNIEDQSDTYIEEKSVPKIEDQSDTYIEDQSAQASHSGNDYSLVLKYADSVLFPGDISSEVECFLPKDKLDSDILICPHHGSAYSASQEFLNMVTPDVTIISCGFMNRYGHPARETLERLRKSGTTVYRTDHDGAVIITGQLLP